MEGAVAWAKMIYKSTLCLGLQALMEHWEWAHVLPKPADAVFKNLWGGFHDPIIGGRMGGVS